MSNMEKTYDPESIEQSCYQQWEQAGYFIPSGHGQPYCIMLPPPNVTGTLHMGHGFQITLMDTLIRYHRMSGNNTLWQVGTDHAGIATQIVVERQVRNEGKTRYDLGREAFVDRIWQWKEQSDSTIKNQLRQMGASFDWTRERFSLDHGISEAVKEVFIRLHDEGLIYRGKRLVNWDPVLLTAVSDLEVSSEEKRGKLWHIRYPIADSDQQLIVATTRPETMLGDTAVAVHPDDKRYQQLIGKQVKLPLTHRLIPIIADEDVDQEFGSGCVKITPAHDFTDYDIGKRHDLPMINILTPDAKINQNAPKDYQGLDRFVARKKILADLSKLDLLEKEQDHILQLPKGEKSDAVIEPYLTDQWYVNVKPLAQPAIQAVKRGEVNFVPENWTKTYFQWLENIEDWCISRQLWWGHRIPAWYDEQGNVYVGQDETEIRKKYKIATDIKLTQDEDVLDTWFSSALWPFATLGWPEKTPELSTFYPTNVLLTGFDIIFFWVARMVMMGLKFTGKVPFKTVYITGLIRDNEGKKMSKSKGNTLDPIDLIHGIDIDSLVAKRTRNLMLPKLAKQIEKMTRKEFPQGIPAYGTDALRFTFCALASTGRDIRFDLGRISGYRNFCNKLWNAARFVLMNTENQSIEASADLSTVDKWILSRLQHTIKRVHFAFETYRFDMLAQAIYEFTWYEYCDWYLELSKPLLTSDDVNEQQKAATRHTLLFVLEQVLRLTHPLMPYITETIWQQVAPRLDIKSDTIMLQPYPEFDKTKISDESEQEIEWLKQVVSEIRTVRSEMNIPPSKLISILFNRGNDRDKQYIKQYSNMIQQLARVGSIEWLAEKQKPACTTLLLNELEILLPMADLIDKDAETARLNKEIIKLQSELEKCIKKLDNKNYVNKAPKEVVQNERDRAKELQTTLKKLQQQLNYVKKLSPTTT